MGMEHGANVSLKNNRALRKDRSKYFRNENRIVSKIGDKLEGKASPEQLAEITKRMLAWNRLRVKKKIKAMVWAIIVTGIFVYVLYLFAINYLI